MTDLIVRKAGEADAAGVALVHVRSWQEAYRGQIDQAYLDSLHPAARVKSWAEGLADDGWPRKGTLVAVQNEEIIGFASFAQARDDDLDPASVVDMQAIYVLPGSWRGGVGRLLMSAAVDAFAGAGYAGAVLWVLDGNTRAARFYETTGWRADGARKQNLIGGREHDVIRMRRTIG